MTIITFSNKVSQAKFAICAGCEDKVISSEYMVCRHCEKARRYKKQKKITQKKYQRKLKRYEDVGNYDSFNIWNMFQNCYTTRNKQLKQMKAYLDHLDGYCIDYKGKKKWTDDWDECEEYEPYFIKFMYSKYPQEKRAEAAIADVFEADYQKEMKHDLQKKWQNYNQLLYCIDSMFSNKYVTKKQWYQRKRKSTKQEYCYLFQQNKEKKINRKEMINVDLDFAYKLDNLYDYTIQVFQNMHQLKNTKWYVQNEARYHDLLVRYVYMQHQKLCQQRIKESK